MAVKKRVRKSVSEKNVDSEKVSKDISKKMLMIMIIAILIISLLSIGIYFVFTDKSSNPEKGKLVELSSDSAQVKVTLVVEKVQNGVG